MRVGCGRQRERASGFAEPIARPRHTRFPRWALHASGSVASACGERASGSPWGGNARSFRSSPSRLAESVFDGFDARMASSGVRWQHRPYRRGRAGAFQNVLSMTAMIRRRSGSEPTSFIAGAISARSFPAACNLFGSVPYVFDTRGYWVDEKDRGRPLVSRRRVARDREACRTRALRPSQRRRQPDRACRGGCEKRSFWEAASRRPLDLHPNLRGLHEIHDGERRRSTCASYATDRSSPTSGRSIRRTSTASTLQLAAMILERVPQAKFLALTSQVEEMSIARRRSSRFQRVAGSSRASRTSESIFGFRGSISD